MYTRINNDGTINKDFVDGVENFISFACNQLGVMNVREIRCLMKTHLSDKYNGI